jgi:hypothetical protein
LSEDKFQLSHVSKIICLFQIISVNGNDLTNSSQEEAAPVLKMAQGKILMKVRRLRSRQRQQQAAAAAALALAANESGSSSIPPGPVRES